MINFFNTRVILMEVRDANFAEIERNLVNFGAVLNRRSENAYSLGSRSSFLAEVRGYLGSTNF